MKNPSSFFSTFLFLVLALRLNGVVVSTFVSSCESKPATDDQILKFAPNFQYLECEFFLFSALGRGLDSINSSLAFGGPPPIGAQMANLEPPVRRIFEEFGYQEIGQIRAVFEKTGGGFSRPVLDLRKEVIAELMNKAFEFPLVPPFNPYANTLSSLITANFVTYNGLTALVKPAALLFFPLNRELVAKLLAIQGEQNAVIRALLYERANEMVAPYKITVAEFTNRTSTLMNQLGKCGIKDEGLVVPRSLGAENRTDSNIIAADANSLSYTQSIPELLRKMYQTGNESMPGGFFPKGANGLIARSYLRPPTILF